jgi:hypothetical protein
MAKYATGFYHSPNAEPTKLSILAENDNGTVDIGTPNGTTAKDRDGNVKAVDLVVVRNCPVSDGPKHGHFTRWDAPADRNSDLNSKTRDELVAKVVSFNASAGPEKQIKLAPNASKSDIVAALVNAQ